MLQKLQNLWKVLKDFFYYNYRCLLGKSRYPKSILPKQNYTPLLDFDVMSTQGEFFIIRRADVNCRDIFNEAGALKEGVLSSKDIPGLSMNLLGAFYLPKHIKFRTINKGAESWLNNSKIYMSDFINDYTILNNFCAIIYKLNCLHNASVPFINEKNKVSDKFVKAFNLTPEIIGTKYKLEGKIRISHAPTNLNFWHVELDLIDATNIKITRKDDNAWARSSKRHILEHFLSVPMLEIPENMKKVDKNFYVVKKS